jgi:signal transduction histidine kinase
MSRLQRVSERRGAARRGGRAIERIEVARPAYALPGASIRAIYLTKAAATGSLLVLFWLLKLFVFPSVPAARYSFIVLLVLVPTLLVALRSEEVPEWLLTVSFGTDIAAVTAGIHFGGGVDNVSGPLLYALTIGLAGLILSGRTAYFCAAASSVAYALVGWGEQRGVLAHHLPYAKPGDDAVATVISVSVYLFVAAWIVSYAARQVRAIYQRIEELRREAVSALSHDLKDPLGTIDGYAEMVAEATPVERDNYMRRIRQSARQALDLVHNELDAAAVEGRSMVVNREPVNINELVEKIVDVYRISAEAKGVRVTASPADNCPLLTADPQLLSRAIGNLLSNAIKYTDANGLVEITTAAQPGHVTVSVRDNGPGIALATQARLFQKYSRVATSSAVEGSGLGLYIVRRIAEAHGGAVGVSSDLGKGSTFTLSLPRASGK